MPTVNPPHSPEQWARIREIYEKVLEAPEDQKAALADLLCAGDSQIKSEVDGLLSAHGEAGSFLEDKASAIFNQLVSPVVHELSIGTVLASRFHILRSIDTGGMGAVYEAWDAELQEFVALKTIRPDIASHPSIIERFKEEVRQAHQVTHRNICRVNDLFSHDFSPGSRLWFLTMQLLKGETLRQRVRRSGPLPRQVALEVVRQIISGLDEAHRHGIVHRDFKSANVMLLAEGDGLRAMVTDFGLASEATSAGFVDKKHAGQGTPDYAAPEQWFEGTATPAADQYSLGVVMCEMVTGERPAPARREREDLLPPQLPTLKFDRHWEDAIRRCLQLEPAKRFHALDDILKLIDPARRRRRVLSWAATVLAAVFVSATAVLVIRDLNRLPLLAGKERTTQITPGGMHLSEGPRFSLDGKTLVFVSDEKRDLKKGRLDVYLKPLPDGPARRVTTYPENAERPAISPQGDRIAFETAQPPAGIYLAYVNGGVPALIARDGHEPSFSPDGRWILYWTGGDEFVSLSNGRIFLYEIATGKHFQLAKDMADARIPLWNSDGDHILFSGCAAGKNVSFPDCKDWWVTSVKDEAPGDSQAERSKPQPRPTGAAAVLASEDLIPTQYLGGWQNDTLVFSARHNSPVVSLWEIKLNPRKARVNGEARQLARGENRDFIISSSIAGKSIAYCEWSPSIHIRRLEKKADRAEAEESIVTYDSQFDLGPSISHNGRWLIFTRGFTPKRKIHIVDTWNNTETAPNLEETEINSPIIDDTGSRIAFQAIDNKTPVIWVSIAGKKKTLCTGCRNPSGWINQSTHILYGDSAQAKIMVKDLRGSEPTTILSGPVQIRDALWSPENGYHAYVRDAVWSPENGYILFTVLKEVKRDDDRRIAIQVFAAPYASGQMIPIDKWIQITGESDYSRKPQWSGDGKTIYYLSKRDGNWCVWGQRFDPDHGRLVDGAFAVQHYHDPKETPGSINASGLNLSVAGDRLYLNVLETTGTVHLGELTQPGLFSREY